MSLKRGKAMIALRGYEHKTLSAIKKLGGRAAVDQVIAETGLSDAAIMRSIFTLQEKKLVRTQEKKEPVIRLAEEGRAYAKHGLPERRIVSALRKLGGKGLLGEVVGEAGLDQQFIPIALGWVQRKEWARLDSKTKILAMHREPTEGNDEKLLKLLAQKERTSAEELSPELREAVQVLKGRKLVEVEEKTRRIVELTAEGQKLSVKPAKIAAEVTQLTPELIISGKWRRTKLQEYNIQAAVGNTWPGKKHPYMQFLDEVKQKLVNLGFKEMNGTAVETSFFNFDALYTPQDHPAREIFGVYLVKSPKYGSLGAYRSVLENVKKTHEDGWKTGSTGWRYKYSKQEAKRLILRGHGTCLSARTLLSKNLEIPGRYFSIARCYRPEVLDKMHLTEFNQVEGIVVEENLTLRDLLGILKEFAVEIAGADEIKFKPDYFPFTEPSVELSAYKKGYGWIEFGGSGIFRPEVTIPLGIKVPVLAWGLGIDRLFMMKAKIDDIRQIFSHDLDWIRKKEAA
ncbi:MAG: phenylalanine--tRNA ligase subunit alpha [Candidatus Bathyarchaeia archaeon]|jgi:phenylalanyl-tRNA synthetase alpha chain